MIENRYMPRMTVLNKIKQIRGEKNLSLRELSRLSGVHESTIERIEKGESSPTQITMLRIAKGLKKDTSEVFNLNWRSIV